MTSFSKLGVTPSRSALIDFLFPPSCLVCNSPIRTPNQSTSLEPRLRAIVCKDCQLPNAQLAPAAPICKRCGESCHEGQRIAGTCIPCLLFSLPIFELRSLYPYSDRTEHLVKSFKYGKRRALGAYIGTLLAEAISSDSGKALFSRPNWDLLVAVPPSPKNLQERGFNHLGTVLREMSSALKIRCDLLALRSDTVRSSQAGLTLSSRVSNTEAAFYASKSRVKDRTILLVDDVLTTGASLCAASKALLENGARRVDALTLARSPRFQINRISARLYQSSANKHAKPSQDIGETLLS